VRSVTEGIDALGHVTVRVRDHRGRVAHGAGADTDIIVASVQAYLRALNRINRMEGARDEAHAV
jgi:2-isopropylmalate synthase